MEQENKTECLRRAITELASLLSVSGSEYRTREKIKEIYMI